MKRGIAAIALALGLLSPTNVDAHNGPASGIYQISSSTKVGCQIKYNSAYNYLRTYYTSIIPLSYCHWTGYYWAAALYYYGHKI